MKFLALLNHPTYDGQSIGQFLLEFLVIHGQLLSYQFYSNKAFDFHRTMESLTYKVPTNRLAKVFWNLWVHLNTNFAWTTLQRYIFKLPTAEILTGKNAQAWVSTVLYLKK